MTEPITRNRRPTILVAYGEPGREWLRKAAVRCNAESTLQPLIESQTLQFWLIDDGVGVDHIGKVRRVSTDADSQTLRELIDGGRRERDRSANPSLNVRQVVVIERWSLFSPDCAPRLALRAMMRNAQRVNCDSGLDVDDFTYYWIALADGVRAASKPASSEIDRARALAADCAIPGSTYLIDRVGEEGATVDADLANECFHHLAMAYLDSDIGAPRVDMDLDPIPAVVKQPAPIGTIIPIAVSVLTHRSTEIERGRVEALRVKAAQGLSEPSKVHVSPSADNLSKAFEKDIEDIQLDRFDPHTARLRRREGAKALIAWAVATRSANDERRTVAELRRQALDMRSLFSNGRELAPDGAVTGLIAGLGAATWSAMVAVALMLLALGYVIHSRRIRGLPGQMHAQSDSLMADHAVAAEASQEWETLCSHLDALLTAWDASSRAARHVIASDGTHEWEPRPPLGWRLGPRIFVAAEGVSLTWEAYERLSDVCVTSVMRGDTPDAAINDACHELLRRYSPASSWSTGAYIAKALRGAGQTLRQGVTNRRFLVRIGTPVTPTSVVWLSAPALALDDSLKALEPATTTDFTVMLSHDDENHSVRIAFGEPRPWYDVLSLNFLELV